MQKIKVAALPEGQQRVESGPVEFEYPITERQKEMNIGPFSDWPGLFIRGDNCMALAININSLEAFFKGKELDFMAQMALNDVLSIRDTIFQEVIQK